MNIVWIIPAVLLVLWLIYAIKSRQIKCFLFGLIVLVAVAGSSIYLTAWGEGWKAWYERDDQYRVAFGTLDAVNAGDTNKIREAYSRFVEEPRPKDPVGFNEKQQALIERLEGK